MLASRPASIWFSTVCAFGGESWGAVGSTGERLSCRATGIGAMLGAGAPAVMLAGGALGCEIHHSPMPTATTVMLANNNQTRMPPLAVAISCGCGFGESTRLAVEWLLTVGGGASGSIHMRGEVGPGIGRMTVTSRSSDSGAA